MSQIRGEHMSSKYAEDYVKHIKPLDFYNTLFVLLFLIQHTILSIILFSRAICGE